MVEITTTGGDGKQQYAMTSMPLKKLPAWLYSISPSKVAPELREKIVRYQEECDDALWTYWTQGVAERPGVAASASKQIALSRHRLALLKELHRTRDHVLRGAIHAQLAQVSGAMGLSIPDLSSIGWSAPPTSDVLKAFWSAIAHLEALGEHCNHAGRNSGKIYLNLPELESLSKKYGINLPVGRELTGALRQSTTPKFLKAGTFKSRTLNKAIKGWIFLEAQDL